ncbi:similarity with homeobox domain-containing protein [Encephalitozoon cuniculi GB-M1]|uniref:Homeobox protein HD-8 n=2 Tax=Encephalitozoon cuniculi TaxID=6035 RepID=HD8_ENCCU|nr:uncharacterized protein ECU03_0600 [Encephalitozoon cuniculi GB-M1]Q8SW51.1 RecName: Full=Homeobox protein HD-8; AltName: Full=EcHD-8 [Encephalitozoon cuniculi GB-M1]ADG08166.1 homeodomain protein class 2 [Encephalitozoon cuniculi]CAD26206.1 similarity with homeobox domain-containing protein [Encephalitozoon cuniculi GB-M1]DAA01302.1 TPA_exp: homeodomain protein EcHD-8 [Encephalitozoon cuniculi]
MRKNDFDVREMNAALGILKLAREGRGDSDEPDTRTRKTTFQMMVLKEVFKIAPHPSTLTKADLALMIKLPLKAVQIWFQNERSRKERGGRLGKRTRGGKSESIDPVRLFKVIMKVLEKNREGLGF